MAVLTVQLGQCGNQLGEELFGALHAEAGRARPALAAATRSVYFSERGAARQGARWAARAVLVDTEPRVVQRLLGDEACGSAAGPAPAGAEGWCYRQENTCWRQGGAANNWAYGFCHHGPRIGEEILERVHREVERCDRMEGLLALHSVAGGTGSGLGSYTLQLLRDAFPAMAITSVSVWPFESGEVSVQSYNAALTLSALYEYTDMVVLCENERYLDMCRRALNEPNPSLASLNTAICQTLLLSALPSRAGAAPGALASPLVSLPGRLCAHPLYRLATARSVPQVSQRARAFATDSWQGLQRRVVQMCESGSLADRLPSSDSGAAPGPASGGGSRLATARAEEAAPAAARGAGPTRSVSAAAFLWGEGACEAPLGGLGRLPMWPLALESVQVHADAHQVGGLERSLGILTNCGAVLPPLTAAAAKGSAMLRSSAYVHQYERCGVGREDLSEALLRLAQVKSDYEKL